MKWSVSIALTLAASCATSPPKPSSGYGAATPDPRELARHNDEWWAYLLATYDKNHDGKVDASEYTRGADSFARLDRDHDGVVTRADFDVPLLLPPGLANPILVVKVFGEPDAGSVDVPTALAGFDRVDKNHDGRVDRDEFEAAAGAAMQGIDRFATLLAGVDADHDGLVSKPELTAWMARRDADGDGKISLRERARPGKPPREGAIPPTERESAPDFAARSLADGQPVTLSKLVKQKPLVLIFGSFT
jgi:Ca2+-binding EF-hand superfamily protein